MPQRPVSHQLEDVSRRRFEELLPAAWVARSKTHDYGTDLEIEIFDRGGRATGMVFLVQLKATDDLREADRLRIDGDHLDYFNSLELPTLLVRYCRADDSFRTQWHFNVERPYDEASESRKSITIRFGPDDRWERGSAARIETTLEALRRIKVLPPSQPLVLVASESGLTAAERYELDEAIDEVMCAAPVLAEPPGRAGQLAIQVKATPGNLAVRIEGVSQFSFPVDTFDREFLATAILYGAVALLERHRLRQHAALVARSVLERGRPCSDREISLAACRALTGEPVASVELALLNQLHHQEDPFGLLFFSDLRLNALLGADRDKAVLKFMHAVVEHSAAEGDAGAEASASYTIGNVHRSTGQFASAVRYYNQARKKDPKYLETPYFLMEVGSCFFLTGHYRDAAQWYLAAHEAGQPDMSFVLGDALFFAGRAAEAQPYLGLALKDTEAGEHHEAAVKLMLCTRLTKKHGPVLPVNRSAAQQMASEVERGEGGRSWWDVLDVDALSDLANFNAGVLASSRNRYGEAWVHFLIAAFRLPTDTEAWANSILCALHTPEFECLESTLSCALRLGGRDTYGYFRREIVRQGADDGLVAELDALSRSAWGEIVRKRKEGLTLRFRGDDATEVFRIEMS